MILTERQHNYRNQSGPDQEVRGHRFPLKMWGGSNGARITPPGAEGSNVQLDQQQASSTQYVDAPEKRITSFERLKGRASTIVEKLTTRSGKKDSKQALQRTRRWAALAAGVAVVGLATAACSSSTTIVESGPTKTVITGPAYPPPSSSPSQTESPSSSAVSTTRNPHAKENACLNPDSSDTAGVPWSGIQKFNIGPNNALVLATERDDPGQATLITPNGSEITFGQGGQGYVAGVETTDSRITVIVTGSGWRACEVPGTQYQPEPGILSQDLQSRQTDLINKGFPGTTGVVIKISGDNTQQTIFQS